MIIIINLINYYNVIIKYNMLNQMACNYNYHHLPLCQDNPLKLNQTRSKLEKATAPFLVPHPKFGFLPLGNISPLMLPKHK